MKQIEVKVLVISGLPMDCYPGGVRVSTYEGTATVKDIVAEAADSLDLNLVMTGSDDNILEELAATLQDEHGGSVWVNIDEGHYVEVPNA
jgi:hypothetical protein